MASPKRLKEIEIPNPKFQIPNKFQAPISNDPNGFLTIRILVIGIYLIIGACR
jgi:hypothetical protein